MSRSFNCNHQRSFFNRDRPSPEEREFAINQAITLIKNGFNINRALSNSGTLSTPASVASEGDPAMSDF